MKIDIKNVKSAWNLFGDRSIWYGMRMDGNPDPVVPSNDDLAPIADDIKKYQDLITKALEENYRLLSQGESDNRDLTAEEESQIDNNNAQVEMWKRSIVRREESMKHIQDLNASSGRVTDPEPVVDPKDGQKANNNTRPNQPTRPRVPARSVEAGYMNNRGFRSMGDFAKSVQRSQAGMSDNRMQAIMNEGQGADGGFLVPPAFRTEIQELVFDDNAMSLMSYVNTIPLMGNQLEMPSDDTTPWGSEGVQAYWTGEGAQIQESQAQLNQIQLKLDKLAALIRVTDELLEDTMALSTLIVRRASNAIRWKIGNSIVSGSGSGQPQGFLNSKAQVTQAKATGQTRASKPLVPINITAMYSRMPPNGLMNAIWLVHPGLCGNLAALNIDDAAGGSGNFPIYMPPGGLSNMPYATLLGRPVIIHDACKAPGTKGDILFCDLRQYVVAYKASGIQQDMSMHMHFSTSEMAFRFTFRLDGSPWQTRPIASAHGNFDRAYFVSLGA